MSWPPPKRPAFDPTLDPTSTLSPEVRRSQLRALSTLDAAALRTWMKDEEFLAPGVQMMLLQHPHKQVRRALAEQKNLLPRVESFLAEDRWFEVRRMIARRPGIHAASVLSLSGDPDWHVRRSLGENPALHRHPRALKRLLGSTDSDLLRGLASNGSLPQDAFRKLFDLHPHDTVWWLSRNHATGADLLWEIFHQEKIVGYRLARDGLAANPSTPGNLVARLVHARDPSNDPYVRGLAASHENLPVECHQSILEGGDTASLEGLAKNRSLSTAHQHLLVHSDLSRVRAALARNPSAVPEVLTLLVRDPEPTVRSVAARRQSLPLEDLRLLARDPDPTVRASAARSERMPLEEIMDVLTVPDLTPHRVALIFESHPEGKEISALAQNWDGTLRELLEVYVLVSE